MARSGYKLRAQRPGVARHKRIKLAAAQAQQAHRPVAVDCVDVQKLPREAPEPLPIAEDAAPPPQERPPAAPAPARRPRPPPPRTARAAAAAPAADDAGAPDPAEQWPPAAARRPRGRRRAAAPPECAVLVDCGRAAIAAAELPALLRAAGQLGAIRVLRCYGAWGDIDTKLWVAVAQRSGAELIAVPRMSTSRDKPPPTHLRITADLCDLVLRSGLQHLVVCTAVGDAVAGNAQRILPIASQVRIWVVRGPRAPTSRIARLPPQVNWLDLVQSRQRPR
eukprot:TRINITY_DN24778_c0_g1_i3.p1 TRINITY_DN24778_c0_g1~~TRINITY_DN24778_c0_g1_i3.p1  ORF type:complete len:323 (+),score=72.42 TRINITY_DN24778_c0_g1_i3:134-970(+)